MWVIFWLISPHQICLHLGFWEWCMHNHLCYYHSLCLFNWLFCYCLYTSEIYTSEIILPFSLLTVFSDHLTMSYIFHIALSNEMKMEKSTGEGQKTENWKVSVKSVLSNFLADSNFFLFFQKSLSSWLHAFCFSYKVMLQWFIPAIYFYFNLEILRLYFSFAGNKTKQKYLIL